MGELREAICTSLRRYIAESGYSQKEIAEKLGVSKSSVTNWVTGKNSPDVELVIPICKLLNITVREFYGEKDDGQELVSTKIKKEAPSDLSEEALKVAKDYSKLDLPGKNVVKVVITEEGKRVQAEKERRQVAPAEPSKSRLIPLYYTPAAAGYMEPALGEDFDYIEVGPDVPRKADCAVRIDGDSMEPYIRDQSIVYITREPLENGDVGIFCLDGDMLCKQYYKDEDGNVRLLSLNRARRDADRFIHHKDSDTIMTYYGRVILPRRPIVSWA